MPDKHPDELNQHPNVAAARAEWHKIVALILIKQGLDKLVITAADVDAALSRPEGVNVVLRTVNEGLSVELVDNATAQLLAG